MSRPHNRRVSGRLRRYGKVAIDSMLGWLALGFVRLVRLGNPDRMSDFAGWFTRSLGPWLPEHRLGRANLAAAYPEKSPEEVEQILTGVWDNLGRFVVEFAHLDRIWDFDPARPTESRFIIPADSAARFERLRADGKPTLIFCAHLANWELPAVAASAMGIDAAILYRPPSIGDIERLARRFRSISMGHLIPTGFDAPLRVAQALERGLHVGMLADQYTVQGVEVTFFGRRTKANPLIARLARHFDCAIHGVRVIRLPEHRFTGEITEAIPPMRDAEGNIDVAGTMQVITDEIERWVREHPEQWLWLHRRWR